MLLNATQPAGPLWHHRLDPVPRSGLYNGVMQIGELAKRGEVGVETIRFYERRGLLPTPPRRPSGYRIYGVRDLDRLRFIRRAKLLGFSLNKIAEIISQRGTGTCPCAAVIGVAERHLNETEEQLRRLSRFRAELRRTIAQWKRLGQQNPPGDAICTLIERSFEPRASKRTHT